MKFVKVGVNSEFTNGVVWYQDLYYLSSFLLTISESSKELSNYACNKVCFVVWEQSEAIIQKHKFRSQFWQRGAIAAGFDAG